MRSESFLILIALFFSLNLFSQTDKDLNKQIDISQQYNPSLADARKIESVPVIEKPMPSAKKYTYIIDQKQVNTEKSVKPIPPADFNKNETNTYPHSFVKIGYGTLNTPLVDVFFNNKQDKKYSYGVQYRFLQSNTNENKSFKDFTDHWAKAYLATYSKIGEFGLSFNYRQNLLNFYGYQFDSFAMPGKKDLLRKISDIDAIAYYNSTPATETNIRHRSSFNFNQFQIGKIVENDYYIKSKIYSKFNPLSDLENGVLGATIGIDFTTFKAPELSKTLNRIFIQFDPRYDFVYEGLNISAGFNTTVFFNGDDTAKTYVNPYIKAVYPLIEKIATLYGGIDGRLNKQSYRQQLQANPFVTQYNLENTYENIKLFLGLTAKIGSSADAVFELNYTDVSNMPLFVSRKDSLRSFSVKTYHLNILKFMAGFNYSFSEVFRLGVSGAFNNYNSNSITANNQLVEAWQLPTIEGKVHAKLNIKNKVYPYVDFIAMGSQVQRTGESDLTNFTTETIQPFYDVSAGIDFRFKKKLSLFVQGNNLVSSRYMRWYNYPVFGFSIIGGLTFIF